MYTGKGISHDCSKPQTVQNVIGICESLEDCNKKQVAAALLKNKMDKDQIESGELSNLSTGGNPLSIIVGSSDLKSKRKPMKQISFQTIMELSTVLELSGLKTKKLCSSLRRSLGNEILARDIVADGRYDLIPIIDCFRKFASVKQDCFGAELSVNISSTIQEFKDSFQYICRFT